MCRFLHSQCNLNSKLNISILRVYLPKSFSRYWHLVSGLSELTGAPTTSSASSALTIKFNRAEISSRPTAKVQHSLLYTNFNRLLTSLFSTIFLALNQFSLLQSLHYLQR